MNTAIPYPIGTPGVPWGAAEIAAWQSRQSVRRSYRADVLAAIEPLRAHFDVTEYGRVDHEAELGVVIGRTARGVKAARAYDYILGMQNSLAPGHKFMLPDVTTPLISDHLRLGSGGPGQDNAAVPPTPSL